MPVRLAGWFVEMNMGKSKYDIHSECPNCGMVHIGREQFVSTSFDESGWIHITFGCPTCDAKVEFKCKLEGDAINDLTAHALACMNPKMKTGGNENAAEGSTAAEDACGGEAPGALADCANGDKIAVKDGSASHDCGHHAQGSDADAGVSQGKTPLNINYMTMGNDSMVTFGIELDAKRGPAGGQPAKVAPHEPTDEEKARLEYFHRQLESLETVDDAIDEIESGYHLGDEDEDR